MNIFQNFSRWLSSRFTKRVSFIRGSEYICTGSLRDNEIVGAIANAVATNVAKAFPAGDTKNGGRHSY